MRREQYQPISLTHTQMAFPQCQLTTSGSQETISTFANVSGVCNCYVKERNSTRVVLPPSEQHFLNVSLPHTPVKNIGGLGSKHSWCNHSQSKGKGPSLSSRTPACKDPGPIPSTCSSKFSSGWRHGLRDLHISSDCLSSF